MKETINTIKIIEIFEREIQRLKMVGYKSREIKEIRLLEDEVISFCLKKEK